MDEGRQTQPMHSIDMQTLFFELLLALSCTFIFYSVGGLLCNLLTMLPKILTLQTFGLKYVNELKIK